MPTDAVWLQHLIAARRFEDVGRRLPQASAADLAAIDTMELVAYVGSLSDIGRRTAPDSLLHELRRRRPADGGVAIRLAGELLSAGLAEDAGRVIEAALEAAEDKGSLVWSWVIHLVGMGLPVEARAQLATTSARYLGPVGVERAAAQIDLAERQFDSAAGRLERIARRHPEMTTVRAAIDRARTCSSIAARFAAARKVPHGPRDYAAFAINLDQQPGRFAKLQAQFPSEPPALFRIPGVKGRYLPDVVAAQLAGPQAALLKGTLGCFLAHVAAWERFRASVFDHALFVEDDATVAIGLPPSLAALDLPPDYDLCFATHGMEPPAPPAPTGFLHVVPVAAAVATKSRDWDTPGTYGYFLSRRGADELLRRVARDGYAGDVDWRLIAYCVGQADGQRLSPDSFASAVLRQQHAIIPAEAPIVAYCLHPALLLPGRAGSIRKTDNVME